MHLHVPDGVLPNAVWSISLAVALLVLVLTSRASRANAPSPGYSGALGALMLAAMAVEIPLGPLEYHLTLIGPLGVLLGPVYVFPVIFIVNLILAFLGHGGLTVVGLNALVLGAGAALARPAYRVLARRASPAAAFAGATALAQVVSGALWLAVVVTALRGGVPESSALGARAGILSALAFPMWMLGIVTESVVAWGTGRFLARVRPDLLPGAANPTPRAAAEAG